MNRHRYLLLAAVLPVLSLLAVCASVAGGKTVVEWTFDRPGDLQGWQANEHVKEVVVTNGAVAGRTVGRDPIFELQPLLDFPASPRQMVEFRLKADADGEVELFWANSTAGPYRGFSQHKSQRLKVCGDNRWRVYRFLPGWQTENRIIRLRFDLYDAARFAWDYLRVVELDAPGAGAAAGADFDFAGSGRGWQWVETETAREPETWTGGTLHCASPGLLLSPPLRFNAAHATLATVRMAVKQRDGATMPHFATFCFLGASRTGLKQVTFPINADGAEHTYHINLSTNPDWSGEIVAVALQPTVTSNATVKLRSVSVGDAGRTPPELAVRFLGCEDALPRAGVPCKVLAVVRNAGGRTASNVFARLDLPAGVELAADEANVKRTASLARGEETRFTWSVRAERPTSGRLGLALTAANAGALTQTRSVRFTARVFATNRPSVPEPRPVRGPFEVGAYYFPGWPTAERWQPIQKFPERRPVLGWYREGDPEVADWQIKWAVEHGITFFAYDWYWNRGQRHLEHGLHDGYFQARYRHLLKFCLLWANHNPPGTSSLNDCLAVTRFWIENYFRRPEHLTFDGKPVVIIYQPERLTEDLGSPNVRLALDAMREACRRAGWKGLFITACVGDAGLARTAAREGYDAITAYTWPRAGMVGDSQYAPFETLVPAYRRKWENLLAESPIPQAPLLVCGGWDSRPWHGEQALVRFGRTPELFRQHLRDAKRFLENASARSPLPPMVLVEAWNEWGEGSYIEPHQQFGFGYLDAIREVFTDAPKAHPETTPADVGLGPYDVGPAATHPAGR
jgi:hypothetical protein